MFPVQENVKVVYKVRRERNEINKGTMGAITVVGIGSVFGAS